MNRKVSSAVVFALASAALVLPAAAAADVTFHVNSTKDSPDKTDVDGKCLALNGKCTLRAAVTEANVEPGVDTIKLPKGTFKLKIPGTGASQEGDLDVTEALSIAGKSATKTKIAQTRKDRIFDSGFGVAMAVSGLTLKGGRADTAGGAIRALGPLQVTRSSFTGNSARGATLSGARGGAIAAEGTLSISRSRFIANRAISLNETADGGAIDYFCASTCQPFAITRSVIRGNRVSIKDAGSDAVGGGISLGEPGTIDRSTISDNDALHAGGIFANSDQTVTVSHSLIAGNKASSAGGGLQASAMVIVDSTLTGNRVAGADVGSGGGAIFRFSGSIVVAWSTIAGNSSTVGGGGIESNDPASHAGGVFLQGVVVGDNGPADDCGSIGTTPSIKSLGYNVVSDASCSFSSNGDLQNKNPKLKALANNGGPTKTMALKKGSPAIGRGASGCPGDDQRGHKRPATNCDSGAFER
jgi:CSLREA domain-containing protein